MDYDTDFDYVGGTEGDIAWCVAKAQLKKVVEDIELVSSECECGAVVIPRVYLDALLEEVK